MAELPKPANLAARGGVWFAAGDRQVHLGVEDDFRPARKAHPALRVENLDGFRNRLAEAGHTPRDDEPLPGYRRIYVSDPFGNRLEFHRACGKHLIAALNSPTLDAIFLIRREDFMRTTITIDEASLPTHRNLPASRRGRL